MTEVQWPRVAREREALRSRLLRWGKGMAWVSLGALLLVGIAAITVMGRVCMAAKPGGLQKSPPASFFDGLPPVLNIAHRGASKSAIEHTVEAYDLALRQGADVLELDLRSTRDGVLVVAHDARLERLLGIDTRVADLSWAELQALGGPLTPLRLEEVFARFGRGRLNLEIKDDSLGVAHRLAEALATGGMSRRVMVASRHDAVLQEFRKLLPDVATSAGFGEAVTFYACYLLGRGCRGGYVALQIPALGWLGLTEPGFVRHAHAQGLVVHFWTVDAAPAQRALVAAGADGIMTNQPDHLRDVLRAGLGEAGPAPAVPAVPSVLR